MISPKKTAFKFVILQTCIVTLGSGCLFLFGLTKPAYSAFLGGMVCVIATSLFALQLFSGRKVVPAKESVRKFYRAEMMKWLITIILFYVVFKFIDINALPFLIMYGVAQFAGLVQLLRRG